MQLSITACYVLNLSKWFELNDMQAAVRPKTMWVTKRSSVDSTRMYYY